MNKSDTENIYENIDEFNNNNLEIGNKAHEKHFNKSSQYSSLRNNMPANAFSKRSKFQGLKKHSTSSSSSSSTNIITNNISASKISKNTNREMLKGKIASELSYQNVPVRNKRSSSPANSSKLSITLSTSSDSSSSQKIENKNLIKSNNYDSLSRFKINNNAEQFL